MQISPMHIMEFEKKKVAQLKSQQLYNQQKIKSSVEFNHLSSVYTR